MVTGSIGDCFRSHAVAIQISEVEQSVIFEAASVTDFRRPRLHKIRQESMFFLGSRFVSGLSGEAELALVANCRVLAEKVLALRLLFFNSPK